MHCVAWYVVLAAVEQQVTTSQRRVPVQVAANIAWLGIQHHLCDGGLCYLSCLFYVLWFIYKLDCLCVQHSSPEAGSTTVTWSLGHLARFYATPIGTLRHGLYLQDLCIISKLWNTASILMSFGVWPSQQGYVCKKQLMLQCSADDAHREHHSVFDQFSINKQCDARH